MDGEAVWRITSGKIGLPPPHYQGSWELVDNNMNLVIVPGVLVCSSFLISVCMFIVSKALLISSATVILRAGGTVWLNPFATMLFNVCSAVTVECCTRVAWVCLKFCKDEGSSPVSLQ